MTHRTSADRAGIGAGENIDGSQLTTGDRNRIEEDRRLQNVSVQFAPSDATLRPGVVYTLQEVFAQVNSKLDEHTKQLTAIWAKLLSMEFEQTALKREIDEMKAADKATNDREEKEQQQGVILLFRLLTVVGLVVIIVMLWWLISHPGMR